MISDLDLMMSAYALLDKVTRNRERMLGSMTERELMEFDSVVRARCDVQKALDSMMGACE